ncbi:MAG: glycosyl transferase family protein [Capsulimonas sp.]|jgi:GT2 family glycosyltransferase|nr:glycosyl transferase family protein [Capsulimonas sp.]
MISVLLCTAGRSSTISACVRRILDAPLHLRELIVVDQNQDDEVKALLEEFQADPRLRYFHLSQQNKGHALNFGVRIATEDIVAITDDDCLVAPDWLREYQRVFQEHPNTAVAFGRVVAAPHEAGMGYIPDSKITRNRRYTSLRALNQACGIGANMAVRRSLVLPFGAFDPSLSPGGRFHASEDRDISIRSVLNGYEVHELAESTVEHLGFRDWDQGRLHTHQDWVGIGAMCSKLTRRHGWISWPLTMEIVLCKSLLPCVLATLRRENPKGFVRVTAFVWGFREGWKTKTDPNTLLFHTHGALTDREYLAEAHRKAQTL